MKSVCVCGSESLNHNSFSQYFLDEVHRQQGLNQYCDSPVNVCVCK